MAKGLFITATGTDVGKTYVTALVVKKLREAGLSAGYYKAALSGAEWRDGEWIPGDADFVRWTAGLADGYGDMVSYTYKAAVSPHLAARMEGNPVTLEKVRADYGRACDRYDYVTVEGSGGIVCPIRWDGAQKLMLTDIIQALALPVLLVADAKLGSINAVALTVSYAKQMDIAVRGIVLNEFRRGDPMEEDNRRMMEEITGVPVVALVEHGGASLELDAETLRKFYA